MRIEMLTTAASPEGVLHAGQVYDLPKREAEKYLKPGPNGPHARPAPAGVKAQQISAPVADETEEE